MEVNLSDVRDRALDLIGNTYLEGEVPAIEAGFKRWFDDQEGWNDLTTNPEDYLAQGLVTYFIDNFYSKE